MRHFKFVLYGLLTFICSLALSGCTGSVATSGLSTGALIISSNTVAFGQVAVGNTATGAITLTNEGTTAVQVSELNLTGGPFSLSGGSSLPMTVGASASVTVTLQFDPTASGAATGKLTIASNPGSSATVSLTGTGVPLLTGLSCVSGSITGATSDSCTVTLNAAAVSGGLNVSLTSNDSAVVVPSSVTVAAGASSAQFSASASAVTSPQGAILTASAGGVKETFDVQLGPAIPVLGISASSLAFGNVSVGSATTYPLVLSSTGTVPVTVSQASLTGTGFSISGEGLPTTLSPGQTLTISVEFDPVGAGGETGQLSLASNSSNGSSTVVGLSGTGVPGLTALNCASNSITGSGTDSCTVTLNTPAASGGFSVGLASNNSLVSVPASVTVAAGASSANFTANVSPVNSTEAATLTASTGSAAATFSLRLIASGPELNVSSSGLSFGNVNVNTAATQTLTLSSTGASPLTINALSISGTGFTANGAAFPMTLNPNQTATLNVQFDPTAAGTASGSLTFSSNSLTGASTAVSLSGTGVPALTGLSCANASVTGAVTDTCTVTLNAAAASGGFAVSLASNNAAVVVPTSVTVAGGAATAAFSATVSAVNVAQAVTLSASGNGVTETFGLQLGASQIALNVSSYSLSFGNVNINTPATQTLTLSSGGVAAVTVSAATVAGTGFTVSGATFPITLTGSQTATLTVQFDPTVGGAATGTLTLTSNSSSGTSTLISLSGTGVGAPTLSGLTCATGSFTAAGTDNCTITLSLAAGSSGFSVGLASNDSSVSVPASVTVAAGATTASFTATVSAVSTAQTATLTASAGSVSETFALQLGAGTPTLSINATSINFGDVTLNSPATQSVTLSSTGSGAVAVSAATIAGTGFSVSGATFPITLNPNQAVTLSVQFDPTVAGAASGTLTIVSTSLTNPTATISLSGTGETGSTGAPGTVNLTWDSPTNSPDPVAGYNVYRSPSGAYTFTQLNSSVVTQVNYVDTTAQTGQAYDYIVESVDGSGDTSAPTNIATVNLP